MAKNNFCLLGSRKATKSTQLRSLSLPKGQSAATAFTQKCHPERSAKLVVEGSLVAFFAAFLLTACGESTTTEKIVEVATGGTEIVESVKDLPKCTKNNEGEQALVKGESSIRVCVDGKWFATVAKDTSSADFSCTTKELKDKSGLKIICNGDSIGVVLNGAAGKDGEKGEQGVAGKDGEKGDTGIGCTIAAQTDSLVTIKCGDKSMTLNLRAGGVTVDTLELDSERVAISLDSLSGYSQKGPFLKGSTVYLYELSDGRTLKQTNGNFTSNINSDDGRYKFTSRNLVSQYALLVVDGKYRNEYTGQPTNTAIKLQAYTNMLSRRSANVNLLTHLEKDRVYYLVTQKKKTVRAAKKQAQTEIFKAFHIDASKFKTESEDLDVFGKTDADAALLAISILLQRDSSETELSVLLTDMASDLAEDGTWDNAAKRAEIAEWAATIDSTISTSKSELATFRNNVKNWELGGGHVPDFEKFVRKFWSLELGLGVCGSDSVPVGTVKNVSNKNSTKFYAKKYTDTTSAGGKIRFICDDASLYRWRTATDIEKDLFNWKPKNTKDGSLWIGPVTGKKMVWDADSLRYASDREIEYNKGCTSYNKNTLIKLAESEFADYGYMCEDGDKISSDWTVKRDESKFGTMTDTRNNKIYFTIKIGDQTWMAENLNYVVEGQSYCYDNPKYGVLYTRAAAVGKTEEECGYGTTCELSGTVRGICPEGWHLPSSSEWSTLYSAMGNSPYAMQAKGFAKWPDATDAYGFSALPAGYCIYINGSFNHVGSSARFWSATEYDNGSAYAWNLDAGDAYLSYGGTVVGFSVRCLQD